MQEVLARSLGRHDPLKEEMATPSSGLDLCVVFIIRNLNEQDLQKIGQSFKTLPMFAKYWKSSTNRHTIPDRLLYFKKGNRRKVDLLKVFYIK